MKEEILLEIEKIRDHFKNEDKNNGDIEKTFNVILESLEKEQILSRVVNRKDFSTSSRVNKNSSDVKNHLIDYILEYEEQKNLLINSFKFSAKRISVISYLVEYIEENGIQIKFKDNISSRLENLYQEEKLIINKNQTALNLFSASPKISNVLVGELESINNKVKNFSITQNKNENIDNNKSSEEKQKYLDSDTRFFPEIKTFDKVAAQELNKKIETNFLNVSSTELEKPINDSLSFIDFFQQEQIKDIIYKTKHQLLNSSFPENKEPIPEWVYEQYKTRETILNNLIFIQNKIFSLQEEEKKELYNKKFDSIVDTYEQLSDIIESIINRNLTVKLALEKIKKLNNSTKKDENSSIILETKPTIKFQK